MQRNLGVLAVVLTSAALAQEAPAPQLDVAKGRVVERPTEQVVGQLSSPVDHAPTPAEKAADRTKRVMIEPAVEKLVGDAQPPDAAPTEVPTEAATNGAGDNPHVEPGKVQWHDGVAAAMAAAKKPGKPVLVFHLLGQLDQRFT
jgi:hypothetical protein